MSIGMFKATVIGNIGHVHEGSNQYGTYITLSVFVNLSSENDDKEVVDVILSGNYLKMKENLKKGRLVYAEGSSRIKRFKRGDGSEGSVLKMNTSAFRFLD